MKTLDCRGLNCPEPVLKTKTALSDNPGDDLTVFVDNETARENVMRFMRSKNRLVKWEKTADYFIVNSSVKSLTEQENEAEDPMPASEKLAKIDPVLFISSDQLGKGSSELGHLLMRNFIYTLTKSEKFPQAIILMNSAVKLSISDSPALESLLELQKGGVPILVCGTCLDYYQLKDQQQAGQVSNMYDIADILMAADSVINL
jgi:selenium metabolism protein YedF